MICENVQRHCMYSNLSKYVRDIPPCNTIELEAIPIPTVTTWKLILREFGTLISQKPSVISPGKQNCKVKGCRGVKNE